MPHLNHLNTERKRNSRDNRYVHSAIANHQRTERFYRTRLWANPLVVAHAKGYCRTAHGLRLYVGVTETACALHTLQTNFFTTPAQVKTFVATITTHPKVKFLTRLIGYDWYGFPTEDEMSREDFIHAFQIGRGLRPYQLIGIRVSRSHT